MTYDTEDVTPVETGTWTVTWLPSPMGEVVVEVLDHAHRWQIADECLFVWVVPEPAGDPPLEYPMVFPLGQVRRFDTRPDAEQAADRVIAAARSTDPVTESYDDDANWEACVGPVEKGGRCPQGHPRHRVRPAKASVPMSGGLEGWRVGDGRG